MKTKIFLTIAFCLLPFALFSQAPQGFNYQAVARAGDNAILANTTLDVKIGLLQGNATGTLVWEETHSVTTNDLGLFTLKIGDTNATGGTGSAASFADIDWTLGSFYMKVQINDGGGYVDLGSSELLSVPYALFAETGNEGLQGPIGLTGPQGLAGIGLNNHGSWSADSSYYEGDYVFAKSTGDPAINSMWILQGTSPFTSSTEPRLDTDNWIEFEAPQGPPGDPATDDQTLSIDGHELTISGGNMVTLPDNVIDDDADPINEIQDLQLTDNDLIITNNASATTIDLSPYLDNTDNWILNGNSVYYMGSVGVGTSTPQGKMAVQGDDVTSEDPLFEVKRKDGQTVFAVYNEGVRVYVDTAEAKGPKGGFAVGGFSASKGISQDYLRITPDSVRVYIDETISKGPKGGFAVGGFSPGKAIATDLMSLTKENYFIGHNSGSNTTLGTFNSFFGYQAGMANSTGSNNVFLGYEAGTANVGASENIFIGNESGFKTSTGGRGNVYIGNKSGHENTMGYYNSFVGYESGFSNTTHYNSFFGYQSGYFNTSGTYNSFFGYQSGYNSKTGSYNIFMGFQAGYGYPTTGAGNSGDYNTFIGPNSGYYNTTGHYNAFVGYMSGERNTVGTYNAFFGHRTGRYNTEGDWNAFFGFQAGYNNTIGDNNSFFGPNSGFYNTTGSNNSFLGYYSGMGNYTGSNNTYIGYKAGYSGGLGSDAEGSDNVFIGVNTGESNTTGHNNIAVGNLAGNSNTGGYYNVFIGTNAGMSNLTGNYNTMIGYRAGEKTDHGFNTMVGYYAGFSNVSGANAAYFGYRAGYDNEGENNTFLGAESGYYNQLGSGNVFVGTGAGRESDGSNNVFIGKSAGRNETGSDKLYIENSDATSTGALIYGEFDNKYIVLNADVRIGGQGTELNDLYVNGDIYASEGWSGSDSCFKKNVTNLNGALEKIIKLRGVSYFWRKDQFPNLNFSNDEQFGVIAQEVEKVFPQLVKNDPNGYKSVAYDKFAPLLIEAIKEQQKQIEELRKEIEALKKEKQ